jgi:hypothetical protein
MNRRISVTISRTINMGNFNSLRVEAGLEEDIADGSSVQDGYKNLWNTVNGEINRAIAAFNKEAK